VLGWKHWLAVLAVVAVPGAAGVFLAFGRGENEPERPSAAVLAQGKALYDQHCASCHGANLEGQPEWRAPLPSGRLPAPPHDAGGHTWHHPDEILFEITKRGPAAVVGGGYQSDMPGFASVISDAEISAILAYIKSTWPERERRYQEEMTRRKEQVRKETEQ
jgi:mono/diheme cytochrome c family protein